MPVASTTIQLTNQTVQDPKQFASECDRLGLDTDKFLGKANSFILPRGKYPGRGWVLLLKSQVDKLDFDSTRHTLKFICQPTTFTLERICVVRAECLTGGQVIGPNDMYVVELADLRYIAHLSSINKNYNERFIDDFDKDGGAASWYSASLNSGSPWTWATMIANIWTNLSFLGALDTTTASYPTAQPENYNFRGISAWDALNKVLDDINHTILLSKAGAFSIHPLGGTDATLAASLKAAKQSLQLNSQDVVAHNLRLPEKVRVFFPKHDYNFQNGTDQNEPTPQDYWRQNPLHNVDVTTTTILADAVPVTGTVHVLHDSTPAMFDDDDSTPNNNTVLNTRATERATNFLNDLKKSQGYAHNLYDGLHNFLPKSEVSAVSWFDTGDGIYTEILRHPSPPEKIKSARLWVPTCHVESITPPDVQRAHEPPVRIATVKLAGTLAAGGKATARIQKGTYDVGTDLITWAATGVPHEIIVHEPSGANAYPTNTILEVYYNWQVKRWVMIAPKATRCEITLGTTNINITADTQVTLAGILGDSVSFSLASNTLTSNVSGLFKFTLSCLHSLNTVTPTLPSQCRTFIKIDPDTGTYAEVGKAGLPFHVGEKQFQHAFFSWFPTSRSISFLYPLEPNHKLQVYSRMSAGSNSDMQLYNGTLIIE